MSKPFEREVATQRADMPHKFQNIAGKSSPVCETCAAPVTDARHVNWQRWEVASRETASEKTTWEIGS